MALPSVRTMLGPLTTTFSQQGACTYAIALSACPTCTTAYQGQTCNPSRTVHDWTDCWPPRSSVVPEDPGVMMGWGIYSPGWACPVGYSTAAMATAGGDAGWDVQFSMTDGETAIACCPTGFGIAYITGTYMASPTIAQTCVLEASSTSIATVQCDSGNFVSFGAVTLPREAQTVWTVYAPLFQLNYRAEDNPPAPSTTPADDASSSRPTASSGGTGRPPSTATQTVTDLGSSPTAGAAGGGPSSGSGDGVGGGLSDAAKIGLGVGIGVGVLILLLIGALLWRSHRKNQSSRTGAAAGGIAGSTAPSSRQGDIEGLDHEKNGHLTAAGAAAAAGGKLSKDPRGRLSKDSPASAAAAAGRLSRDTKHSHEMDDAAAATAALAPAAARDEHAAAAQQLPAEIGGEEIRELEAIERTQELPTRLPSDRRPPSEARWRVSDQAWLVDPHEGRVFELEGDSGSERGGPRQGA